ncbi:hypothetical protein Patl1_22599 [Pistacia atlantica]|uniref:Uncharacterized protein n=1 Tax=Pistacia atlantica TaxID=434234 RepID=A0ACC0ZXX7_9ROSI|nr:hypothetical protein Patl1_22599 [Pistacia atlantica]
MGERKASSSSSSLAGGGETPLEIFDANIAIPLSEREERWLENILNGESFKIQHENAMKMERVSTMLREVRENSGCYDPLVVSIGPYHFGNTRLELMERHKLTMARQYVNGDSMLLKALYQKVKCLAETAKESYADQSSVVMSNNEEFSQMLLLDACFLLQFIYCIVIEEREALKMKNNMIALVQRDLFLLENQIPFLLLNELMRFNSVFQDENIKLKMLNKFVTRIRSLPPKSYKKSMKIFLRDLAFGRRKEVKDAKGIRGTIYCEPAHLLDLLRTNLFDKTVLIQPPPLGCSDWFLYRSAKDLKAVGFHFRPSETNKFTDVAFQPGCLAVTGILKLPPICIDDSTKSLLLNMVAYESSNNGPDDFGVSSYICLMDSLIDHAEDVKELRSKGILLNFLGSDQQVADLFNKIAENLVAHPYAYADVKSGIEKYYKKRSKKIGSTQGKALAVRLLYMAARLVVKVVV